MTNRRTFIKNGSAITAGSFLIPGFMSSLLSPSISKPLPGLQLFTFFNVIDNDVTGTLKQIASIGYKNIESAFSKKGGYYGMKPKEFANVLNDLGMSWKSHHVLGAPFKMPANAKMPLGADGKPMVIPPMKNLRDNFQQLVDEAAEGGVEFLVCANTPIGSKEEIKSSIAVINKSAEAANKAGLKFAYHNHDAEFHEVEGVIPYHLLVSETDPKHVKMELDLAWAVKGGADPVELFEKHPGRFPLWHVKDLDASRNTILPVGEGTIDFKRIFEHSKKAGLEYYFIEHDMPKDPVSSITTSIMNLRKL